MKKYKILAIIGISALILSACGDNQVASNTNDTADTVEESAEEGSELGNLDELYSEEFAEPGEYKGMQIEFVVPEPSDDEVEAEINQEIEAMSSYESVSGRSVQDGDIVNIDYVGKKDGVAFDGGTAQGYDLTIGSGQFIPGFESGLIGANKGDEVELNLTFPENYGASDLAGQDVIFTVTINDISEKVTPELNDDTVSKMGEGYKTVEEFRQAVRDNLYEKNKSTAVSYARNTIIDKLRENSTIKSTPEWLLNTMTDNVRNNAASYAAMYGLTIEDFVSQALGETMEEFEEECKEYGKNNAEGMLITFAIANKENLKISDEELKEKLDEYMQSYGMSEDELEKSGQKDYMTLYIQNEKVIDFIYDNAEFVDEKGNKVTP